MSDIPSKTTGQDLQRLIKSISSKDIREKLLKAVDDLELHKNYGLGLSGIYLRWSM